MNMLERFLLSASAVAGVAVIWRNWIADHPDVKKWIEKRLGKLNKVLLCGSCFTYWVAFFFTLAAQPLSAWLPFSGELGMAGSILCHIFNLFVQWMALAWLGVSFRFGYVVLQELVHYQVHHLRGDHTH